MASKSKTKTAWVCSECGYDAPKWFGQCPSCKAYNTMKEFRIEAESSNRYARAEQAAATSSARGRTALAGTSDILDLSEIEAKESPRILIGFSELERALGGGFVPGSVVLIGGDPGIGKSTLLLQAMCKMVALGQVCLYASGEESPTQVALRAQRLGVNTKGLKFISEIQLEKIEAIIEETSPQWVVIDSIQTMFHEDISSAPGSVSQVREATSVFMQIAKRMGISIFIVGHVTKEGVVAGPRVLEHMVDTVLYFEGDRHAAYRILRGVKNRFGSTNEIGVFEMCQSGLKEVKNPSEYMLSGKPQGASGSIVSCSMEGTRPILVEVQALVCRSNLAMPRRTAAGTDYNRVGLLMAVIEKRIGMHLSTCDAYVNIAGGIRMNEPAIDLAIVLALISSYKDIAIDEKTLAFGEVGLSGEIRAVSMAQQRVAEARKLGFETIILPAVSMPSIGKVEGIRLLPAANLREALKYL